MKYKKKPVVIEAFQLKKNPGSIREIITFMGVKIKNNHITQQKFDDYVDLVYKNGGIEIPTLEGKLKASFDDYIIKGVNGEFYPCKPDIFKKTYELVD